MDAGCGLILALTVLLTIIVSAWIVMRENKKRKDLCREIEMLLAGFD